MVTGRPPETTVAPMVEESEFSTLVILGAGGHGTSIADVSRSAGLEPQLFVDPARAGSSVLGLPVVAQVTKALVSEHAFAVAVGDNARREQFVAQLRDQWPELVFPPLVHQKAWASSFAQLEEGTVLMPQAVVGPNCRVGRFCIVNTAACLDHDCVMEDFSSLAPGAVAGGNVRVAKRSAVSIGAVVKHGVSIGEDTVLGAGSYLHGDLPGHVVAYGSPARVVRSRAPGDTYL